ncbi:HdeD family acid-resistance protein [Hymenobacter sp. BT188]|uniref:HdeD family acid-resistance protein n=1 Tax=Hymenobacter sp. BT188 TaxID=2763504 RepID=UPI001650F1C2|nr:HdeD family acid-resistance protein [Hymenobacter sp. BT188]MBC6605915.1 HdeD family acid-resistance protein [Hymenobacter sp. BT188]
MVTLSLSTLQSNWWLVALRGLGAVVFGLLTFLLPGITLLVLITMFGVFCLFNGVLAIASGIRRRNTERHWWTLILEGFISMLAGLATLIWPGITSLALLYFVAFWSIATGILQVFTAIRLRKQLTGEWMLILGGLLSVAFGLLLVFAPVSGALVITWWIGAFAFVYGIILCILAFRLRKQQARQTTTTSTPPSSSASPTAV